MHTGAGTAQYCIEAAQGGCICGVDINCCSECTLGFVDLDGMSLKAGVAYQIDVFENTGPGNYTLRVDGPV